MAYGGPPRCYLLELPPELRLRIFDFVFDRSFKCTVCVRSDNKYYYGPWAYCTRGTVEVVPSHYTSVLETCRVLYREAMSILREKTIFSVAIMNLALPRGTDQSQSLPVSWKIPSILHTITKISSLNIEALDSVGGDERKSIISSCIDATLSVLGSRKPVKVDSIKFDVSGFNTDELARALLRLRCEPGANVRTRSKGMVSPEVCDGFMKKFGATAFEPYTPW